MAVFSAATSLLVLFLSISSPFVHVDSAPAVDCSTVVLSMVNCVAFVTIGGKDDQPSASCCSGLKKVLDVNPECLCEGLKNSDSLGVKVNVTKAATLPALCKLTAPPVSACALSGTPPASAPVPAAGPRSAPASNSAPSPSPTNHGSSLIPISGLSFVISAVLVTLFSRI